MPRLSVATIDSPEFVNVTSISPLISKCEIKILYVGENRNGSFISKEVATQMAETLPGCPIVGYYIKDKEDFGDHGDQLIIDGEGIKFNCLTTPYGFVAPDSKIWFKKFEDTDDFGNIVVREYLMTEGYLWTGQFEEAKRVIENGNPQSMELDEKTLDGHWAKNNKTGVEFFIINDAMFSKLCILGEDVEPCFEGANVSAPEISSNFSKDTDTFAKTLFSMMEELKFALKGGEKMDGIENSVVVEEKDETMIEENFSLEEDKIDEIVEVENQNNTEEFSKKDDEEEDKKEESADEDPEDSKESESDEKEEDPKKEDEDDEKDKKKFELLEQEYNELKNNYAQLEQSYNELVAFKAQIENKQKDELIESFYMLSDEDKKEVMENKEKYSLDDIEAKLSVICVRKKVSFDLEEERNTVDDVAVTFNLMDDAVDSTLPAWLKAVEATKNRNKN